MEIVSDLSGHVGRKSACSAMAVSRATYYRQITRKKDIGKKTRPAHPLILTETEEKRVLDELHSERFRDSSPSNSSLQMICIRYHARVKKT